MAIRDPFFERIMAPRRGEPRLRRGAQPSVAIPVPPPEQLRDAPISPSVIRESITRRTGGKPGDIKKIGEETRKRIEAIEATGADLDKLLGKAGPPPGPIRRAIGGAARGFATGFGIPGAAGPTPGVSPRAKLSGAIRTAQAKQEVKAPFKKAQTLRDLERQMGLRRAMQAGRLEQLQEITRRTATARGVSEGTARIAQGRAERALFSQGLTGVEPNYVESLALETDRQIQRLKQTGIKGAQAFPGVREPAGQSRTEVRRALGLQ